MRYLFLFTVMVSFSGMGGDALNPSQGEGRGNNVFLGEDMRLPSEVKEENEGASTLLTFTVALPVSLNAPGLKARDVAGNSYVFSRDIADMVDRLLGGDEAEKLWIQNEIPMKSPLCDLMMTIGYLRIDSLIIRNYLLAHLDGRMIRYLGVTLPYERLYPAMYALAGLRPDLPFMLKAMLEEKEIVRLHKLAWVFVEVASKDEAESIIRHSPTLAKLGATDADRERILVEVRRILNEGFSMHPLEVAAMEKAAAERAVPPAPAEPRANP